MIRELEKKRRSTLVASHVIKEHAGGYRSGKSGRKQTPTTTTSQLPFSPPVVVEVRSLVDELTRLGFARKQSAMALSSLLEKVF